MKMNCVICQIELKLNSKKGLERPIRQKGPAHTFTTHTFI